MVGNSVDHRLQGALSDGGNLLRVAPEVTVQEAIKPGILRQYSYEPADSKQYYGGVITFSTS